VFFLHPPAGGKRGQKKTQEGRSKGERIGTERVKAPAKKQKTKNKKKVKKLRKAQTPVKTKYKPCSSTGT
jgi:hypothetical protein